MIDNNIIVFLVDVLIETLWNVKRTVVMKDCALSLVLIETLWNVKIVIVTASETGGSF